MTIQETFDKLIDLEIDLVDTDYDLQTINRNQFSADNNDISAEKADSILAAIDKRENLVVKKKSIEKEIAEIKDSLCKDFLKINAGTVTIKSNGTYYDAWVQKPLKYESMPNTIIGNIKKPNEFKYEIKS